MPTLREPTENSRGEAAKLQVAGCKVETATACNVQRATSQPAIFLDRDGTVIEQVHHLSRVDEVAVFPFAREALQLLTDRGYKCVIVTNQSAIGRGLLDKSGLKAIHDEMLRQLGGDQDLIHGIYYCPMMPVSGNPRIVEFPDRKPGPGMLQRASSELNLSLDQSWMVGDAISDMLAGRNAGCRGTVLVRTGYGSKTETEYADKVGGNSRPVGSHASLLPTTGGEGGRRPDEGGDRRFKDKFAGCTVQGEKSNPQPATPRDPAIDHITDNLLTAARLIVSMECP